MSRSIFDTAQALAVYGTLAGAVIGASGGWIAAKISGTNAREVQQLAATSALELQQAAQTRADRVRAYEELIRMVHVTLGNVKLAVNGSPQESIKTISDGELLRVDVLLDTHTSRSVDALVRTWTYDVRAFALLRSNAETLRASFPDASDLWKAQFATLQSKMQESAQTVETNGDAIIAQVRAELHPGG